MALPLAKVVRVTPTTTPTITPRGSDKGSEEGKQREREGSLLYYDNGRSQWHKVFAALHSDGSLALHATGCRGSHHFRPVVHLTEVATLYRTPPAAAASVKELPQLYGVVFALELKDGELMLLRTTEPKGAAGWTKALEAALSCGAPAPSVCASAKVKTLDDLRSHRAALSPHFYSQLFRDRQDPTAKLVIRCGVPPAPTVPVPTFKDGVIRQRRASLSAQTPVRALPVRRPPLIPVVSAHFKKATQQTDSLTARDLGGSMTDLAASASASASGSSSPTKRPLGDRACPNVPSAGSPKAPRGQLSSRALEFGEKAAEGEEEVAAEERTPGSERLTVVSPSRAVARLNSLIRQESGKGRPIDGAGGDTTQDSAVITGLKAQIERLTRRNIDLQISELNSQTRVLELEQMAADAQSECDRLGSRCMALQNALDAKDAEWSTRLDDEKKDLMQALKAEVEAQWHVIRQEWALKEAEYKQLIETLTEASE